MNHPTEQKNSTYTYNTYYYAYTSRLVPRVPTLKRSLVFSLCMSKISHYISCKKKNFTHLPCPYQPRKHKVAWNASVRLAPVILLRAELASQKVTHLLTRTLHWMGTCWLHGANKSRLKTHHSFSRLPPETNTGHCNKIQYTPCPLASDLQYHVRATQSIVKVETAYQSTRRPQASHTFYSTYKIRLAITSSQLKVQLV